MSPRAWRLLRTAHLPPRRNLTSNAQRAALQFASVASAESSKFQIYLSTTDDPYLNLSIEHHLLQTTHPSSTVLFFYANRPCVVIGRNQNPWLETNLARLSLPRASAPSHAPSTVHSAPQHVELVRRRSGGGTVFHGPGNVNYSVICPPEAFTRDLHAQMVARALHSMNLTARVNARHDIVIDADEATGQAVRSTRPSGASPSNANGGASNVPSALSYQTSSNLATRKVSGSAFKLTRTRALHHGTCLLCTPHLGVLSDYLASPAAGFLDARGVDSVRSPVANVLPPTGEADMLATNLERFYGAVLRAFADQYSAASLTAADICTVLDAAARRDAAVLTLHAATVAATVGPHVAALDPVRNGMAELRSEAWLFGQTPRFTLRAPSARTAASPARAGVFLAARGGVVTGAAWLPRADDGDEAVEAADARLRAAEEEASAADPPVGSLGAALRGRKIWQTGRAEWAAALEGAGVEDELGDGSEALATHEAVSWLTRMLPQTGSSAREAAGGTSAMARRS